MNGIETEVRNNTLSFIKNNNLASSGVLLVAVSGGPDSVCLLHVLNSLKTELGISIHTAHLDHQLRGNESEADALYVTELSRRMGIPVTNTARNIMSYKEKYRLSLEEAAREVRYSFFVELAKSIGAKRVAVGHTRNDNIETILMHVIRGCR